MILQHLVAAADRRVEHGAEFAGAVQAQGHQFELHRGQVLVLVLLVLGLLLLVKLIQLVANNIVLIFLLLILVYIVVVLADLEVLNRV